MIMSDSKPNKEQLLRELEEILEINNHWGLHRVKVYPELYDLYNYLKYGGSF